MKRLSLKRSSAPKSRKTRRQPSRKNRRAKLSKPVRKAVATVAMRALGRETKYVSSYAVQDHNSTITGAGDMYALVPGLDKGDGGWQRNGLQVTAKGLYVKGSITVSDRDVTLGSNLILPLRVRVMIIRNKRYRSQADKAAAAADLNKLLKPNIGTDAGGNFDGATYSLFYPVNKEVWDCCLDEQCSLTPQGSGPAVAGQGGQNGFINYPMNPGYYQFRTKVPIAKHLLYDETNGSAPMNDAWYLVVGYAFQQGEAPDTVTTQVRCEVFSTLYFTDD